MQKYTSILLAILLSACSAPQQGVEQDVQSSSSVVSSRDASSVSSAVLRSSSSAISVQSSAPAVSVPEILPDFDPLADAQRIDLPSTVSLSVPFTPQAPDANWDPPFDEACEEASLLMVEFAMRSQDLPPAVADREIRAMVNWQTDHGFAIDIPIVELEDIAERYFGRKAKSYYGTDVTVENIKRLLAAGYPVIIPAAGQDLGNPYFSGDGPPYHMLTITGYTRWGNFITNDPGTRRGEGYTYNQDHLVDVIHDWNGSTTTIHSGPKAMLVVGP